MCRLQAPSSCWHREGKWVKRLSQTAVHPGPSPIVNWQSQPLLSPTPAQLLPTPKRWRPAAATHSTVGWAHHTQCLTPTASLLVCVNAQLACTTTTCACLIVLSMPHAPRLAHATTGLPLRQEHATPLFSKVRPANFGFDRDMVAYMPAWRLRRTLPLFPHQVGNMLPRQQRPDTQNPQPYPHPK